MQQLVAGVESSGSESRADEGGIRVPASSSAIQLADDGLCRRSLVVVQVGLLLVAGSCCRLLRYSDSHFVSSGSRRHFFIVELDSLALFFYSGN